MVMALGVVLALGVWVATKAGFFKADSMKFRPLASLGTPWRHSKIPHRCDTRRHDRSGDHKKRRRRVLEYRQEFAPSSMSSYRNFPVSAAPDIVLRLKAQCPWQQPYP